MAQAGMQEIMDEIANQIRAVMEADKVANPSTAVDVQVESGMVLTPTPPTIDVYPGDTPRDRESAGFSAGDDEGYFVTVRARVSTADNTAGQALLVSFIDPQNPLSIGQALADKPTLNGYASDLDIITSTGFIAVPDFDGAATRLGCLWTVRVIPGHS